MLDIKLINRRLWDMHMSMTHVPTLVESLFLFLCIRDLQGGLQNARMQDNNQIHTHSVSLETINLILFTKTTHM